MRQAAVVVPWVLLSGIVAGYGGWWWSEHRSAPANSAQVAPIQPHTQALSREAVPLQPLQPSAVGPGSYHGAVVAAAPAVVNIFTAQKVPQNSALDDPLLRRFFEYHGQRLPQRPTEESTSLGSGVIVDGRGYILTNNHVVAKADQITVALQDGRHAQAKVVGTDPDSDLAVIQIQLDRLPVLQWRSTPIQVGDVVLAIGNPFGVGQTVTQGIISATGRSGLGINTYEDFIQTDAAINPGNSGGALVDAQGQLIGINTAIFSRSGGSMGIGFAIPVTLARQVMDAIIKDGKVVRGWLGVEVKGNDPAADGGLFNEKDQPPGVLVMGLVNRGPADQAGLRSRDRILSVNGQTVTSASQLIGLVAQIAPNTAVPMLIQRGGEQLKLSVTIGQRPEQRAEEAAMGLPEGGSEDWFSQ